MEAQPVDGGHGGLVGGLACKLPGDQTERIGVIGIHVLDDSRRGLGQRVGQGASVVLGGDPSHHPETPDEINAREQAIPMMYIRTIVWGAFSSSSRRGTTAR